MAFMNILPDPVNKIKDSGVQDNSTGTAGPGFTGVRFRSKYPSSVDRTNGGRVITRSLAAHYWEVDISYNPMKRAEFEPVNGFLMSRQGRLLPFFIILPQYSLPRDSTFAAYAAGASILSNGSTAAGAVSMNIDGLTNVSGSPKPGDIFNITDSLNSNHVKAYMVTRCETNGDNNGVAPTTLQRILHFTPSLTYTVPDNTVIKFINPQIRVVMRDEIREYDLSVDNLFQFNLSVEEALP